MSERKITIGLTGGIGTGKSTVAGMLEELGAHVLHADRIGHEIYRPGTPGWEQVTRVFGPQIIAADGSIDRRKLGEIVFADEEARARLNAIVHPLIRDEIRERIGDLRNSGTTVPIVVEAAILVEANWVSLVDEVWLLVTRKEAVIERVCAQRQLSPQQIESRMEAQLDDKQRRRHADVIIENNGDMQQLRAQVEAAWNRLQ